MNNRHVPFLLLLLLTFLFENTALAQSDEAAARAYAEQWFAARAQSGAQQSTKRSGAEHPPLHSYTHAAALRFEQGDQFLLLSKGEATPRVLGYGTRGGHAELPAALRAVLGNAPCKNYPQMSAAWHAVAPLLTSVRHQKSPYNSLCPYYRDPEADTVSAERCVVGCVATAVEQVLSYYRRVYTLRDTLHGWETEHYAIPDVLPGASVDARLIADNYDTDPVDDEQIDAVARLSYWLGVAAHMNWGLTASGTNTYRIVEPLTRAFGLPYVHHLDAYQYAPLLFWNCLAAEIMAGRPVYFAGGGNGGGGHAFVLDGLDADGLFHVCWGNGGQYDGYFRPEALSPAKPEDERRTDLTPEGYYCNQEALLLCPDSVSDSLVPDTLERTGLEVVVDSLWLIDEPAPQGYTRVGAVVRNTAAEALTTTFALVINAPTDTARFEQCDLLTYECRTLAPGARDTLLLHAPLGRSGQQEISVTADAVHVLDSLALDITATAHWTPECDTPTAAFPTDSSVVFTTTYRSSSASERSSNSFVYDLLDEVTNVDCQKTSYIYAYPDAPYTEQVGFTSLRPGRRYTLRLRRSWGIYRTLSFTMPGTEGISAPTADVPEGGAGEWFTLDGRRVHEPAVPGVYIYRRGGHSEKYIKK